EAEERPLGGVAGPDHGDGEVQLPVPLEAVRLDEGAVDSQGEPARDLPLTAEPDLEGTRVLETVVDRDRLGTEVRVHGEAEHARDLLHLGRGQDRELAQRRLVEIDADEEELLVD